MDRDGRWGLKSWLRIVTVVLSVAGIILFGSAINDYTLVEDGGLVGRTAIDFGVLIAVSCLAAVTPRWPSAMTMG